MDSKEALLLSKVIFALVVALGFFTVLNITTYKSDQQSYLANANRSPSSLIKISELENDSLISKATVSTLDLNCIKANHPVQLKSQSHQLRLIGRICNDNQDPQNSKIFITNTRNGYQATVFPLENQSFSTDYVFLEKGKNSIVISQVEDDNITQTPITELLIERQDKFILDSEDAITQ